MNRSETTSLRGELASREVPGCPEEVTVEWLDRVLAQAGVLGSNRVERFDLERPQRQGATSEVVILRPEYTGPSASPAVVVAKFQISDERIRGPMSKSYQREVEFYRHFGSDAGIPIPACYFAFYDASRHRTLLLLEFVENAAVVAAKQITLERLRPIVRSLAAFHAKWWGREEELVGRKICDEQTEEFLRERVENVERGRRVIEQQFVHRYGAEDYLAMLDRWLANAMVISDHVRRRTRTLCHNDFHPGQLCLAEEDVSEVRVFDWQEPAIGLGTDDLATLLSHIVIEWPQGVARGYEAKALRLYHRQLVGHGVPDYSFEQFQSDYQISVVKLLTRRVGFFGKVGVDVLEAYWKGINLETDMWTGMYARQSNAIGHHRLLAALDRVSSGT